MPADPRSSIAGIDAMGNHTSEQRAGASSRLAEASTAGTKRVADASFPFGTADDILDNLVTKS